MRGANPGNAETKGGEITVEALETMEYLILLVNLIEADMSDITTSQSRYSDELKENLRKANDVLEGKIRLPASELQELIKKLEEEAEKLGLL